ncbi:MAG: hypothetical protein AAGK23_00485 [Pseudomonadota bacterium]
MIDVTRLGFDPLIGWPWLVGLAILATAAWAAYLIFRGRAWLTRGLVLTLLAAALSNPAIVREERDPLPSVAAIVLDRSESMGFGERAIASEAAFSNLRALLGADEALEVRTFQSDPTANGTDLFAGLEGVMADVPRDRIAGAILITDGQVHDVPAPPSSAGDLGPIHALVVGDATRGDRRVEIVAGPTFGIVGETAEFVLRVDDPAGGRVQLDISLNGQPLRGLDVEVGVDTPLDIEIERRGDNVLVVEAPPGPEELTLANNRTAATLSGVRDRLRVLLITGKPHAAGRVWRDLLKSDPQVDLVHFTILRPPYSNDFTPIEELALIPFPTGELFEDKLADFDLIIFDQYERRGVVTWAYLDNMARYVDEGGALLIAAGEPFAGPASLARTPLAAVLPATPTGEIMTGRFVPDVTDEGVRHAVTAPLSGRGWGGWLRYIEAESRAGDVLMSTPDGAPLLVVDRVGKGRVGQLLSDQIWLWARGHEGGGPFSELIRRLVHWMMKEPELEERQLALITNGDTARATLRTLSDTPPPLVIETPEGTRITPDWREIGPGQYSADLPIDGLGLYRARAGGLEAVALNGPANPKEYVDLRSVTDRLEPVASATGGGVFRLDRTGLNLPDVRRVGRRSAAAGNNWIGLREREAFAVRDSRSTPVLPGILAALLAIGLMLLAWRREGR